MNSTQSNRRYQFATPWAIRRSMLINVCKKQHRVTHTYYTHWEWSKKNTHTEPPSQRQHRLAIVKSVVKTEGNTNTARKTRAKLLYGAGDGGKSKKDSRKVNMVFSSNRSDEQTVATVNKTYIRFHIHIPNQKKKEQKKTWMQPFDSHIEHTQFTQRAKSHS